MQVSFFCLILPILLPLEEKGLVYTAGPGPGSHLKLWLCYAWYSARKMSLEKKSVLYKCKIVENQMCSDHYCDRQWHGHLTGEYWRTKQYWENSVNDFFFVTLALCFEVNVNLTNSVHKKEQSEEGTWGIIVNMFFF